MSTNAKLRFGLWYDFRNPPAWKRPYDQLYGEIFEQIAWAEQHGFEDIWLTEHHFVEDGYSPSLLPIAAAIAARTKKIRIGTFVLLLPLHHALRVAEDAAMELFAKEVMPYFRRKKAVSSQRSVVSRARRKES